MSKEIREEIISKVQRFCTPDGSSMSFALPCIGTNNFDMIDMIQQGENGLLIERSNSDQLKDALLNMLSDPVELERLGANTIQRVFSYYNWDAVIERMSPYITNGAKN